MLLVFALFTLKSIIAPIAFALIIAILLNPLVNKLQRKGVKRILAITIALLLTIVVVGGILYFISTQIMSFGDNLPVLKQKFNEHLTHLHNWIASKFNVPIAKQQKAITDALNNNTTFAYDSAYRLTSVTDAALKATTYSYDLMSNLTGTTDALAHTTNYE